MPESEVGLRISLRDRRAASAGIQATSREVNQLGDEAQTAGRKAEWASRGFAKLRSAVGFIGRSVLYGASALGALGVAAAVTGIKTAAGMETARIAFTTMLGSGEKARDFIADLSKFAAKTPFEFTQLQTAASSLISAGIDANKVIPIMTTLGDVTAGMGTGAEGIQRATVALQQMNAAQRITGEDLNQLRDAGIPVYDLLAASLGKTKAEVVELAQAGKLGKGALDAMMRSLETGRGLERFTGLMDKQSKSLSGVWSTLRDTVTMGLAKAIKPAIPMLKDLTLAASDFAKDAMPDVRDGVRSAVDTIQDLVDAYQRGGMKEVWSELSGDDVADGASKLGDAFGEIGESLSGIDWGELGSAFLEGGADTIEVAAVAFGFLADHLDVVAQNMPLIIGLIIAYKGAQAAANLAMAAAVPLRLAEIAATRAHTQALREHAAAAGTAGTTAGTAAGGMGRMMLAAKAAAGMGGMLALAHSTQQTSTEARALESAIGGALLGFSVAGPMGAAIGGVAGLASALSGVTKTFHKGEGGWAAMMEQAAAQESSFDSLTGAATQYTRELAAQQLQTAGITSHLTQFGLTERQLVDAALGHADAMRAVERATRGTNTAYTQGLLRTLSDTRRGFNVSQAAMRDQIQSTRVYGKALDGLPRRVRTHIEEVGIRPTTRGIARLVAGIREFAPNLKTRHIRTIIEASGHDVSVKRINQVIGRLDEFGKKRPKAKPDLDDSGARRKTSAFENFFVGSIERMHPEAKVEVPVPHGDIDAVSRAIAGIGPFHTTIFVDYQVIGPTPRAAGGPVTAGQAYVVGEKRPELFVPTESGRIYPRVPNARLPKPPTFEDEPVDVAPGSIDARGDLIIQTVLPDGRVLAETVLENFETQWARR